MTRSHKKIVIGVAGKIASGTTEFAEHVKITCNASTYRFSNPLRDIVGILQGTRSVRLTIRAVAERFYLPTDERGLQKLHNCICGEFGTNFARVVKIDRDTLQRISTALRSTFGEDCLAKAIFNDLQNDTNDFIIVEGVRRLADIENLRKLQNFTFVYVDADFETRFSRVLNRDQYGDEMGITRDEFRETCAQESESQIRELKQYADVVINNNVIPGEAELYGLARYHEEIDIIALASILSSK